MREIVFINRNIARWQQFEQIMHSPVGIKPDDLADLFIQLTDDLAFSRTHYPKSEITRYLNMLAIKAHAIIYKNKKEKKSRITTFWKYEFPLIMYQYRRYIFYSGIALVVSALIGIISASIDVDFIRLVMGDFYVDMTIENIKNNDPMAVYKQANEVEMFLGITLNNIKVAFWAFILGIFLTAGTGYILFFNGIMLGSFHYFMYEQGVLFEAMKAIWIHGTIEIFAIVIAGAAGILMGNSILFPETFSRKDSFKAAVKTCIKIMIGIVPFFIIAGFIEGFITRYTNAPDGFRLSIIALSVLLIIWYFFIYPRKIYLRAFITK